MSEDAFQLLPDGALSLPRCGQQIYFRFEYSSISALKKGLFSERIE